MNDDDRGPRGLFINAGSLNARLVMGLIILLLGVLWTLDNLGLADAGRILEWWPALLFGYGLAKLVGFGVRRQPILGGILAFFGAGMLAKNLGWVHFGLDTLWPIGLIAVGASLVLRAVRGPASIDKDGGEADENSHVSVFAFMGANTRKAHSQALRSADVSAVMAGAQLDLREAKAATDRVIVDVFAMWGGIEVLVPEGWRVVVDAVPIMGGVEDKTIVPSAQSGVTTVIIRGLALMGGIEVLNKDGQYNSFRVGVVSRSNRDRDVRKTVVIDHEGIRVTRERTSPPDPGVAPGAPPAPDTGPETGAR